MAYCCHCYKVASVALLLVSTCVVLVSGSFGFSLEKFLKTPHASVLLLVSTVLSYAVSY